MAETPARAHVTGKVVQLDLPLDGNNVVGHIPSADDLLSAIPGAVEVRGPLVDGAYDIVVLQPYRDDDLAETVLAAYRDLCRKENP